MTVIMAMTPDADDDDCDEDLCLQAVIIYGPCMSMPLHALIELTAHLFKEFGSDAADAPACSDAGIFPLNGFASEGADSAESAAGTG